MTSSKKLIAALAVSLPLVAAAQTAPAAAPAAPAKPLFTIYGTLNLNFQVSELPGSANPAQNVKYRFGLSTDSSNIGVRGTADVAYGLGVVYQCETSAAIDGIGTSGICNRNSRIGLSSPYGTLFYGNWDTPYKSAWYGTKADDPFGNTDVFDAAGILSSPGLRTKSTAGTTGAGQGDAGTNSRTFAVRAADSVAYHSPKIGALSFKAQYSANRFSDADLVRTPELYSAGANYDMGPFSVLAAWERHVDWGGLGLNPGATAGVATNANLNTGSPNTKDDGFKAGVGYELGSGFGTTTISVNGEYLTYKDDAAAGTAIDKTHRWAGFVGLKHRTGDHEFRLRYSMADELKCDRADGSACDLPDTGAQQWAVGYAHYLSKAAQVYAYWTQIFNDDNAQYTFGTAGLAAVTPGPAGALGPDPWAAGLGMRYAF